MVGKRVEAIVRGGLEAGAAGPLVAKEMQRDCQLQAPLCQWEGIAAAELEAPASTHPLLIVLVV